MRLPTMTHETTRDDEPARHNGTAQSIRLHGRNERDYHAVQPTEFANAHQLKDAFVLQDGRGRIASDTTMEVAR